MKVSEKTFSLKTYRAVTSLLAPIARLALSRRLKIGKEDPARVREREGFASKDRPEGDLIWVHGASVGESLSVLPLIERLLASHPAIQILVTTGTVTSASLMEKRLPERAFHQYAPIDQPQFVAQFLDHWRPDAALFIESELWPIMLSDLRSRGVPLALVNGRLSPKSFSSWSRRVGAARELFDAFDVMLAQDDENADRIEKLAGRKVHRLGNLKRAAPPLPTDEGQVDNFRADLGKRPVWLAASTHAGEEVLIADAHTRLKKETKNILTIVAPRHPERGQEVEDLLRSRGFHVARRSSNEPITPDTDFYIADTLGELGIFYRVADVAFIGGSLLAIGGHNPMEPARLGTAIVTGPHIFNFAETFHEMRAAGALALVRNERDLVGAVQRLLADPRTRNQMASMAQSWADAGGERVLSDITGALAPMLERSLKR